ncbi:MAG: type II toxin-antitoxin system MqsR family toxin [Elusimicrobiales bacterium]
MAPIADWQVTLFLDKFKKSMARGFYLVPREKNLKSLAALGMPVQEAKRIIAGLTPADYYAGPKPDNKYQNCDVWEFVVIVSGEKIYIKLSSDLRCGGKCISFHHAEH